MSEARFGAKIRAASNFFKRADSSRRVSPRESVRTLGERRIRFCLLRPGIKTIRDRMPDRPALLETQETADGVGDAAYCRQDERRQDRDLAPKSGSDRSAEIEGGLANEPWRERPPCEDRLDEE